MKITINSEGQLVIKMSHSDMKTFCDGLQYLVDQYVVINERHPLSRVKTQTEILSHLYESLFLSMYNRLMKKSDCPLRERYHPSDKYSVKLDAAEALAYWAALNPLEILRAAPGMPLLLDGIHKQLI